MLRHCVELCPADLWSEGTHPRAFWRIAYHATFYAHYYMMPAHDQLQPWEKHDHQAVVLWLDDESGVPPEVTSYSQAEVVEYIDRLIANVPTWLAALDLDSEDSGFPWYPIPKLDHLLVNLRHVGVHTGQLQELLYARGIEPRWVKKG